MQLAMVAADFTAGEADQLRRAMAAWKRKGGLEPFEARLREGMLKNGYTEEFAERVFSQICGFGEYGFPESHSASFALLAYVSAWIKHYEPAAFLAALLNSQPMGFYSPSVLVQDAQRHGVQVRAGRRHGERVGLHARARRRRCADRAPGSHHGERPERSRRTAHRRGTRSAAVPGRGRSRAARRAQSPRSREPRPGGRARGARRTPPQRALARRGARSRAASPARCAGAGSAAAPREPERRRRPRRRLRAAWGSRSGGIRSHCCAGA